MTKLKLSLLALFVVLLFSCSSSYNLTKSASEPGLEQIKLDNFLIMVLYPDDEIEVRVALEKSIADHLAEKNINAKGAYAYMSSYENLENKEDEILKAMNEINATNLLLIDPIRAQEYSNNSYHNEMAVYRALDMRSAEFWGSVGSLIDEADATKYIMGVSLFNKEADKFLWQGTYDIKAPGGYDLNYAKLYSKEFTDTILEDIKKSM